MTAPYAERIFKAQFIIKAYRGSKGTTYDILTECKPLRRFNAYDVVDLFYEMNYIKEIAENNGYIVTFKVK